MTQADSAPALRRSLDSSPTQGQGQAANPQTAAEPLPKGWASFCSKADTRGPKTIPGRWYAVAPWHVDGLKILYGPAANVLDQTVTANTWPQLCVAVEEQEDLHAELIERMGHVLSDGTE